VGLCSICGNKQRDASLLFVVEKTLILNKLTQRVRGLYFVLGGTVPLASEEPAQHVRLRELLARVEQMPPNPREIFLKMRKPVYKKSSWPLRDHRRRSYATDTRENCDLLLRV